MLLKVADLTEEDISRVKDLVERFGMTKFARAMMLILGYVFHLPESKMLWKPDCKRGSFVLSEVMQMGNFGHSDERFRLKAEYSHLQRYRKTVMSKKRFVQYFPIEVFLQPIDMIIRFFEIRKAKRFAKKLCLGGF